MSIRYKKEFKLEVVKAYRDGNQSIGDIAASFNVAKSTVVSWVKKYDEECQYKITTNNQLNDAETSKEIRRLNMLVKEQKKEIEFLKKAAAFFAKEID